MVRFRNGARERKHEKCHLIKPEADRVAFSLFRLSTVLAGLLRLSVPNTCRNPLVPKSSAEPPAPGDSAPSPGSPRASSMRRLAMSSYPSRHLA